MELLLWIVGGIIALALVAWGTQALTGFAVSVRASGRFYLSAELKKLRVRQYIPQSCVNEIADEVTDTYSNLGSHLGWSSITIKTEMLQPLERDARVIAAWVGGRDIAGEKIQYIPDSLKKNGVPLGATPDR